MTPEAIALLVELAQLGLKAIQELRKEKVSTPELDAVDARRDEILAEIKRLAGS